MKPLTEPMLFVLLALKEGAKCGTEIVDFAQHVTQQRIKMGPGTLYTILARFEAEGWIVEISRTGRMRKYEITAKGMQMYHLEHERLQSVVKIMNEYSIK
ncbi:PadR family transcriptional regulator [Erysipelothrix tonsillarum]|uniref:PadR family transcriptional regulator n=1 Tax=Erysipelothrix tonsillarum TaxID=38402 RepID=UPI00036ABEA2|nr:helix-turn-helix transcriptional regulator [Erysipelothrix tonsillarum]